MKRILIYMLLLITFSELYSQGLYNNGAKIVVGSGTFLNITGGNLGGLLNTTSTTDGAFTLNGTLKVEGNITNNVSTADMIASSTPSSTVVLSGTTAQTLSGISTAPFAFSNLSINNSAEVDLSKDVKVAGVLGLTSGLLDIGSNNLILGSTATIGGTPTALNMIVANGSGQVRKLLTGIGSFTFPIGDNTAKYSPVTLNFTSGTFATGAYATVNVVNAKYNDPLIKNSYLNRYWNVNQTGISAFACDAIFQYLPSDVTGTESNINGLRVLPTPITTYNAANATLHQLNVTGLATLGTFTGGASDKVLNLSSVMLEGLYNGGGTMRQASDEFGAHWPVGVADHITVELHDATTYATIAFSATDVPLSTTGTATVKVPGTFTGNYYITIKHRNSLETTSATAVSFVGNTINQSYGSPANVFGGNLQLMIDNGYAIFAGDIDHDGIIGSSDMTPVDNDASNYMSGYLTTDVNGNGSVDSNDMTIIDNNSANYVGSVLP